LRLTAPQRNEVERFQHEIRAPSHIKFVEQSGDVKLHSAFGKVQTCCDLFVGEIVCDSPEHFVLTPTQRDLRNRDGATLDELFSTASRACGEVSTGGHHDAEVSGQLLARNTVKGQQTDRLSDRGTSVQARWYFKKPRSGFFVEENEQFGMDGKTAMVTRGFVGAFCAAVMS
jgi:hypothetical protein